MSIKLGDKVLLQNDHPFSGKAGEVIAIQEVMGKMRPRVRIDLGGIGGDHEVFVMRDDQASVINTKSNKITNRFKVPKKK